MHIADGGCGGLGKDLAEPPVIVAGVLPDVDADGKEGPGNDWLNLGA